MSNTTAVQKSTGNAAPVAAAPVQNSGERFTAAVVKEFGSQGTGAIALDERKTKLVQGYFVYIDRALKIAEGKRVANNAINDKNKESYYNNNVPVTWDNVNLQNLARDIVINANLGLCMSVPNQLYPIPYYNRGAEQYDVTLMKGYNGIIHVAEKYALNKPKNVRVELVYSTDHFAPVKKSKDNDVESYEFEIKEPFKRGNVIGGFGYLEFDDDTKNKLVLMSLEAILKRKPKHATPEFWGGTKKVTKKVDGKKVEVEEVVAGWVEEMYLKVLKREVYSGKYIPIDPDKIDSDYQAMVARELDYAKLEAEAEIEENANTIPIEEVAPTVELPPPSDPAESEPF